MANGSSPFEGYSWYNSVRQIFESKGIKDEKIWGPIVGVESLGNPKAVGDAGKSFGLFQLYTAGGLGDAYRGNSSALFDPTLNATIAAESIQPAYEAGKQKGLSGYALTEYVAANSGFPLMTGDIPANYRVKLRGQYSRYETPVFPPPELTANPLPELVANQPAQKPAQIIVLSNLAAIEQTELSILKPAESAKKIAIQVLLVLLGLAMVIVGLVAFIGVGKTIAIVTNPAGVAAGAAAKAATGIQKDKESILPKEA